MAEKLSKKIQSISKMVTSPRKPKSEFIAMMNKEVAAAFFIGKFANKTKIGTIIKPPPAPTKPVINPVKAPKTKSKYNWLQKILFLLSVLV